MIRALIVDDEPLARQYLKALLRQTGSVLVVGEAGDAASGLRACAELAPDAVFLDIRMPGPDGLRLAAQLTRQSSPSPSPQIIFVTGHADRALDAIRVEAVDYLLKPLEQEAVAEAVRRLSVRCLNLQREAGTETESLPPSGDRLTVRTGPSSDTLRLLAREDIVAALRHDRRTWVHTAQTEYPTYYPLGDIARWLGGAPFLLVARDALINLEAVSEIIHYGDRLYQVRLCDRTQTVVQVSRSGASRLSACLKPPF